jgi:hypothetical protein
MHIIPVLSESGDTERQVVVGCESDVLFMHFMDDEGQMRTAVSDSRQYAFSGPPSECAAWALRIPTFQVHAA